MKMTQMKKKILIIEDEIQIAEVLKLELEYEDFEVALAYDGISGLEQGLQNSFDLILLDVMLPKMSGTEVLRRFRKKDKTSPVILLTARNTTSDKVMGLDLGANDYVTKPFEIEELLARIRSAIRQKELSESPIDEAFDDPQVTFDDLIIDTGTREVHRGTLNCTLTQKEYELLMYLIQHKNHVVTRESILNQVWGYEFEGDTNVIDVYIRHLRRKLDDPTFIQTIRGAGYCLKERSS